MWILLIAVVAIGFACSTRADREAARQALRPWNWAFGLFAAALWCAMLWPKGWPP